MRKRLAGSVIGALVGLLLGSQLSSNLGFTPQVALAGCIVAGAVLGYVASLFFDVFTSKTEDVDLTSHH